MVLILSGTSELLTCDLETTYNTKLNTFLFPEA